MLHLALRALLAMHCKSGKPGVFNNVIPFQQENDLSFPLKDWSCESSKKSFHR